MTGYTVHTGSNDKFREGWDNVFGGTKKTIGTTKKSDKKTSTEKSVATNTEKTATAKTANKKSAQKKK